MCSGYRLAADELIRRTHPLNYVVTEDYRVRLKEVPGNCIVPCGRPVAAFLDACAGWGEGHCNPHKSRQEIP